MPVVMTVYGTRPEAIKVAPVLAAIRRFDELTNLVVVTGQHREMLDGVHDLFDLAPDHDLEVMRHGQSLSSIAARVLTGTDELIAQSRPDLVLVQGDTTTSTAAALAAFYRRVPVVHLEAGLRSFDLAAPFPEEANRQVTARIATLHLAPTERAKQNLLAEGIGEHAIAVTGNTVIDALLDTARRPVAIRDPALSKVLARSRRILLVTAHRRENWGAPMAAIGRAIATIASRHPELTIVLPAHKNPAVREALLPGLADASNIVITEPLSYTDFTHVLARSYLVLTDSGGVQEEAPAFGRPVLVMRDNTERPEGVEAGTVRLVGTDEGVIVRRVEELLADERAYSAMANAINPYGDGRASERAVAAMRALLGTSERMPDFAVPSSSKP